MFCLGLSLSCLCHYTLYFYIDFFFTFTHKQMHMYIKIDTGTCTDMYMYLHVHTCKDTTVAGRILFDSTLNIYSNNYGTVSACWNLILQTPFFDHNYYTLQARQFIQKATAARKDQFKPLVDEKKERKKEIETVICISLQQLCAIGEEGNSSLRIGCLSWML